MLAKKIKKSKKKLEIHFFLVYKYNHSDAPVAQLDRASDYGSEGCKFESCRVRHLKTAERQFFFILI